MDHTEGLTSPVATLLPRLRTIRLGTPHPQLLLHATTVRLHLSVPITSAFPLLSCLEHLSINFRDFETTCTQLLPTLRHVLPSTPWLNCIDINLCNAAWSAELAELLVRASLRQHLTVQLSGVGSDPHAIAAFTALADRCGWLHVGSFFGSGE